MTDTVHGSKLAELQTRRGALADRLRGLSEGIAPLTQSRARRASENAPAKELAEISTRLRPLEEEHAAVTSGLAALDIEVGRVGALHNAEIAAHAVTEADHTVTLAREQALAAAENLAGTLAVFATITFPDLYARSTAAQDAGRAAVERAVQLRALYGQPAPAAWSVDPFGESPFVVQMVRALSTFSQNEHLRAVADAAIATKK
jgi:hypothetical protein